MEQGLKLKGRLKGNFDRTKDLISSFSLSFCSIHIPTILLYNNSSPADKMYVIDAFSLFLSSVNVFVCETKLPFVTLPDKNDKSIQGPQKLCCSDHKIHQT